jgi:hypothetical protein
MHRSWSNLSYEQKQRGKKGANMYCEKKSQKGPHKKNIIPTTPLFQELKQKSSSQAFDRYGNTL